ncbi:MAG: putative bifunctional diguanylate cyclase/phosphodiesterase, partial [Janthinobacterium lividum]
VVPLLHHILEVLRAGRLELTLDRPEGGRSTHVLDVDGRHEHHDSPITADPYLDSIVAAGSAVLVTNRGRDDDAGRRWLAQRDGEDALVVPIAASNTRGALVTFDRVGDTSTFTPNDLALLQTLTGHLGVAISNAQLVRRLRQDAGRDALTGLPNRALLADRITQELTACGEPPASGEQSPRAAVLLLDLNRFKEVNDALGHHVGDELLRVVAARIAALDLPGATVARLGGDEFAVLLPARLDAEAAATAAAHLITTSLGHPVALPEATLSTGASIGIAFAQQHSGKDDLLRHADTAMYAAKTAVAPFAFYDENLDRGRVERLSLLADLHQALEADELTLHYQPKFDLAFGVVTSVEALVRWTHPRLGPLSPDTFVPLAESTGLIEPFTRSVLAKALQQCRQWMDDGFNLSVAVNLSARNISNPDLPENVAAALVHAGVPAERLILEITESSVMGDAEHTVPILERLAAIGVTLSLDDFGTGYSSLAYLQRLPVRELKIDRSFVVGLEPSATASTAETSAALIRSITGLKSSLGLRIVAEGVEDGNTMALLGELGCDLIQGYHVGRPAPAEQLTPHLRRLTHSEG